MTEERVLIDRAAGGDSDAFAALARMHRPVAVRLAVAVLGDPAAAEDVAQEVLIRLDAALPAFRRDSGLDTWVYRVTMNRCRDHLRRSRAERHALLVESRTVDQEASSVPDPVSALDLARASHAVVAAIERLPEEQQEVIRLRFGAGLSYPEIVERTGLPHGTVASRVFRALKRLGQELESRHLEVLK